MVQQINTHIWLALTLIHPKTYCTPDAMRVVNRIGPAPQAGIELFKGKFGKCIDVWLFARCPICKMAKIVCVLVDTIVIAIQIIFKRLAQQV